MGISATELAEAPLGTAEAPEGQKLAGRSPTQIALERLRKDKVAVVCSAIVVLMVLSAVLAPVITKLMKIYPTAQTIPYDPSNVLGFGGPDNGMPLSALPRGRPSTTWPGCCTACAPTS
jgi:hypothetical protein